MTRGVAVMAVALVISACTGGSGSGSKAAPPTSSVATEPVPTTAAPAPAPTTTITTLAGHPRLVTTVSGALGPGTARLAGSVVGPGGAVPGASVRVERLAGTATAATTVQTGPDGRWALDSVNGGRYRLRAWRAPDMAQLSPTLVFVVATQPEMVDLTVARFGDGSPVATVTPNPPVVGQPASLVVMVGGGSVDADGILHSQPRPGVTVQLVVIAGLALSSPDTVATDASGNAGFTVTCTQPGPPSVAVNLDGARRPLDLPPCSGK
ncbi:MAG: carboxypeptidase-like regulatory domain-containing protein [Acidimicrobiales bacterium]